MATIAKRRDRWVIDFVDTNKKRRWITMPKGSKKKDAKDKLLEIEDQLAKGIYIPENKIPTFKQVADDWLEYKKPNILLDSQLVACIKPTVVVIRIRSAPVAGSFLSALLYLFLFL
jgi:hypothetical protein